MHKEKQRILKAPQAAPASGAAAEKLLVFDACHLSLILRAVVLVEAVVAIAMMFKTRTFEQWAFEFAVMTGGVLPATLAWLVVGCGLKRQLAALSIPRQWLAGCMLGALAGLMACRIIQWIQFDSMGDTRPAWIASACSGALLGSALVSLLIWRSRSVTPAATAARLTELQARIRPHFLFNALNSAITLVRTEPQAAETLLEDLSDIFRHALKSPDAYTSLEKEIALAKRYLAIERVRFGTRMVVKFDLDSRSNAARLPPLLLQPLLENAVKHGVEESAEEVEIKVRTRLTEGDRVIIEITNTLPRDDGMHAPGKRCGNGMALDNVRERLALLHDVQSQFKAGAKDGKYRVRIVLPFNPKD